MSLKEDWKATGTGIGHAFRNLGKSIVKTVATGVNKADEWANSDAKEEAPEKVKADDQKKTDE